MTRTIQLEIEVPGTPEEVWEAIASGPGISSWFVPSEVAREVGGELTLEFGPGMTETGRVTAYEPPARFAYVAPADGERQLAYEWLVEPRPGGTCVVRLVNSGFGTGADADGDFKGMDSGWRLFLQNLRLHLTHFAGQPCAATLASASAAGSRALAWSELTNALGLDADAAVGDRIAGDGGAQPLAGTVDWKSPEMLVLRLETPAPGIAFVAAEGSGEEQAYLSVWIYARGEGVDGDAWHAWMAERFPAPAGS